ncbi:hypothetical protein C8R44DRAFT_733407 [Mycena epipterygia]|nr:hypothetical protein C8R44DRAFT_733407 [Mycena epipterygia]
MHADPVFPPLQLKCEIMDPEFTETPFHIDSLVFVAPLPESQFKGDGQETVPDSGVGSVVNDIATKPHFDIKRRIYPALWSFLVSISGYAPFIFSTEIDGIATATDSQSIKRLVIYTATYRRFAQTPLLASTGSGNPTHTALNTFSSTLPRLHTLRTGKPQLSSIKNSTPLNYLFSGHGFDVPTTPGPGSSTAASTDISSKIRCSHHPTFRQFRLYSLDGRTIWNLEFTSVRVREEILAPAYRDATPSRTTHAYTLRRWHYLGSPLRISVLRGSRGTTLGNFIAVGAQGLAGVFHYFFRHRNGSPTAFSQRPAERCFRSCAPSVFSYLEIGHFTWPNATPFDITLTNPGATVTLVNVHLAAFDEMFEKWNTNFHDLAKTAPDNTQCLVLDNLNYRIDADADFRVMTGRKDRQVKIHRQLKSAVHSNKAFEMTYRFNTGLLKDDSGYDLKPSPASPYRCYSKALDAHPTRQVFFQFFSDHSDDSDVSIFDKDSRPRAKFHIGCYALDYKAEL